MVIVLIRRCVRADKVDEFLAIYKAETPTGRPGFLGETLTKVDATDALPEALRNFTVEGPNCVTFVNVAKWESAAAFEAAFHPQPGHFDRDIETEPRVRAVLEVLA